MNKKLMFLCAFICFFTFGSAKANTLNSIDTTVYIDENGNGRVTENLADLMQMKVQKVIIHLVI